MEPASSLQPLGAPPEGVDYILPHTEHQSAQRGHVGHKGKAMGSVPQLPGRALQDWKKAHVLGLLSHEGERGAGWASNTSLSAC